MFSFSIIIINFKTKELTRECLDFIVKAFEDESYEIILVDNNSQDGSANYLKNIFVNKIKIIENKVNFGFSRANNQAAKQAKGELLFFLNSDTLIEKNILPTVRNFFVEDEKLGIAAPRLILSDGSSQPYAYGHFLDLAGLFRQQLSSERVDGGIFSTDWVSGAALFIRRELFERLGGFDENFFMYFEDMDLCKRARETGFEVKVIPGIEVTHLVGASGGSVGKQKKDYYNSQNYFFRKHHGLLLEAVMRLVRWPYRFIRSFY